jgi:hypothetical protein
MISATVGRTPALAASAGEQGGEYQICLLLILRCRRIRVQHQSTYIVETSYHHHGRLTMIKLAGM